MEPNTYKYPSHSRAVAEFTRARLGGELPNQPRPFDINEIAKMVGLVNSEFIEMLTARGMSQEQAVAFVHKQIGMDPSKNVVVAQTEDDLIEVDLDSGVDALYYMNDIYNSAGMPLDRGFDEVHDANMLKKFPDGTFHTTEIAPGIYKVIKPPTWHELGVPDMKKVVREMNENGSWN